MRSLGDSRFVIQPAHFVTNPAGSHVDAFQAFRFGVRREQVYNKRMMSIDREKYKGEGRYSYGGDDDIETRPF